MFKMKCLIQNYLNAYYICLNENAEETKGWNTFWKSKTTKSQAWKNLGTFLPHNGSIQFINLIGKNTRQAFMH